MIRNVIFDLGGVLLSVDWEKRFAKCNLTGEKKERVRNATIASKDWLLLDKGIPKETVMKIMIEKDPGMEPEIRSFLSSFEGVARRRDYTKLWVRSLKGAGLNVYVLSNFCRDVAEDCSDQLGFLGEMDGVVFSYDAGMVKPDKEIYRYLLGKYSLKAEECVFLDDRRDNLEAGEKEGIKGILFVSQKEADRELRELLGVEIPDIDTEDSRRDSLDSESIL